MKFKPALSVIAIALAMTSAAFSQTGSQTGNAPKLLIKQTEYNFGEVKKGDTAQHAFTFKNEGKADLEIRNVAPS